MRIGDRDSWGIRIELSEVKFSDLLKTDYCGSTCQGCFHWSRTKVVGDRRRSDTVLVHKPCQLEIGGCYLHDSFGAL